MNSVPCLISYEFEVTDGSLLKYVYSFLFVEFRLLTFRVTFHIRINSSVHKLIQAFLLILDNFTFVK